MTAAVLFGLALGLFVTGPTLVLAADLYNCDDFATQADAQAVYDYDTNDPNQLDGNDDDGRVCENSNRGNLTFAGYLEAIGAGPTATTAPVDATAIATTAPVDPMAAATTAPVDPTATTAPGEPTAVPTDEPLGPTVVATNEPIGTATAAPAVVARVTDDSGSATGSHSVSLPNTGTGDSQSSSLSTMTLLLALFAGA